MGRAVSDEVVPVASDIEAAVRLGRAALSGRPWAGDRGLAAAEELEAGVRRDDRPGALYRVDGQPRGILLWNPLGSVGVRAWLAYLEPEVASIDAYARFLAEVRRRFGPIAFVPGEVPGLRPGEEERLMTGLGFASFGRSEMRRRDDSVRPRPELPPGGTLRRVGEHDTQALAQLHRAAYHGTIDRYLFLEEEDELADARRMMGDLFSGRWGPVEPAGSVGIELDGRLVAAVLAVRRRDGVLIADVMVDPSVQGRGLGRAVLLGSLEGLARAGATPVFLAVTESNDRAKRLYASVGFERTLGPEVAWYDPARIPLGT